MQCMILLGEDRHMHDMVCMMYDMHDIDWGSKETPGKDP